MTLPRLPLAGGAKGRCSRTAQRPLGREPGGVVLGVESCEQGAAQGAQVLAAGDGHQMLPADGLAPRLHATLVVAGAWSAEARLEQESKDVEKQVRAGKRKVDARAGASKKTGQGKGGKRKGR